MLARAGLRRAAPRQLQIRAGAALRRGWASLADEQQPSFADRHGITLKGNLGSIDATPVLSFASLTREVGEQKQALPTQVQHYFNSKKYDAPTPIQAQSLPLTLSGRDVVAIAQTGSGKTVSFLLPLLWDAASKRKLDRHTRGPLAFILAPTRELAQQIHEEARPLAAAFGCRSVCVFGGQKKYLQEREVLMLGGKLDLIVGTPGRLADMIRDQTIRTQNVRFLVLDEADRMLDMGFEPQLRDIVDRLPACAANGLDGRQTCMFSATWPEEVRQLAMDFLHDPIRINVGGADELVAAKSITQHVHFHQTMGSRLESLVDLVQTTEQRLKDQGNGNARSSRTCHTVVFVNRKRDAETVASYLEREVAGVRAEALHGDLLQGRRDRVRDNVKSGRAQVLVATDVAARGLDVKTLCQVVNFDMPGNLEDYIHRIGRTGRAGAKGDAITFFNPQEDQDRAKKLAALLRKHNQNVPKELEELVRATAGRNFNSPSFRGRGDRRGTYRRDDYFQQGRQGDSYDRRARHQSRDHSHHRRHDNSRMQNYSGVRHDSDSTNSRLDDDFMRSDGSYRGHRRSSKTRASERDATSD